MKKKHPLSEEDKAKIVRLHLERKSNFEIRQEMGLVNSTVQKYITYYYNQINSKGEGYFNVNELECWIFPSSLK